MKKREICLLDLIFEILLKWRMIIIFMVIGAVLLGGYSYLQSINNIDVGENSSATVGDGNSAIEEDDELTFEEKRHIELVYEYEKYGEYYDNSLLMKIDAQNVAKSDLIWCVQTSDIKNKNTIVATYTRLLATGMTEWLIQNGMNAEKAAQISELVSIGNDNGAQGYSFEGADKGSIYVSIMHIDEEHCRELVAQVKEFVASQKSILDSNYGTHQITMISEKYATVIDEELLTKQRTILTNAITENHNVKSWKLIFSDNEKKYYDMLKGIGIHEEEDEEEQIIQKEPIVVKQLPSISIKYVILGMVLLTFVYVFFVFITYIFNNRLRGNDNLSELYEISQLGSISITKEKKKFMSFVDAWIIALRDRNKRKFTQEEEKEITAVAIKMAAKKAGSKEVYFIGCELKKQTADICDRLKAILQKEDIKISVVDNVLYNAEEMEKLYDAKCVVLIEKAGATMYDEVTKELELLKRYNINILGGVLVD